MFIVVDECTVEYASKFNTIEQAIEYASIMEDAYVVEVKGQMVTLFRPIAEGVSI